MKVTSETQPHCPCCMKPLRKRTVTVYVESRHASFHRDTEWSRHLVGELHSKADCQARTNQVVVSVKYQEDRVRQFGEWDGKTYDSADGIFCSGSCAAIFGKLSYEAGFRLRRKQA